MGCAVCTAGTWGLNSGDCTNCATVANALAASGTGDTAVAAATYTCTTASDSQVSACAAAHWKDTSGAANVCTAHTVCGKQVAVGTEAAADRATTTAGSATADTVCGACSTGTYGVNAGNCANCVAVTNALAATTDPVAAGATYTCTTALDSRVSACAAAATTKKTVGADGAK